MKKSEASCRMACNFIARRGARRISCDTARLIRHYFAGNIHESALWLAEKNPMAVEDFAENAFAPCRWHSYGQYATSA